MLRSKKVVLSGAWAHYPRTRLFSDGAHYLLFADDRQGTPLCFLFLGGLDTDEKYSLSWNQEEGLKYRDVDSGDWESVMIRPSPLHGNARPFDPETFRHLFTELGSEVDQDVLKFVLECVERQ
ncbi:MAG: hypothetical protein ACFCUX_04475 [Candidatus Methylacidiphilales bacterium]